MVATTPSVLVGDSIENSLIDNDCYFVYKYLSWLLLFVCQQVQNKILYTGSSDWTGKSWVVEFGDCTRTYKGHKHSVSCIKFVEGLCEYSILFYTCSHMAIGPNRTMHDHNSS